MIEIVFDVKSGLAVKGLRTVSHSNLWVARYVNVVSIRLTFTLPHS